MNCRPIVTNRKKRCSEKLILQAILNNHKQLNLKKILQKSRKIPRNRTDSPKNNETFQLCHFWGFPEFAKWDFTIIQIFSHLDFCVPISVVENLNSEKCAYRNVVSAFFDPRPVWQNERGIHTFVVQFQNAIFVYFNFDV